MSGHTKSPLPGRTEIHVTPFGAQLNERPQIMGSLFSLSLCYSRHVQPHDLELGDYIVF